MVDEFAKDKAFRGIEQEFAVAGLQLDSVLKTSICRAVANSEGFAERNILLNLLC